MGKARFLLVQLLDWFPWMKSDLCPEISQCAHRQSLHPMKRWHRLRLTSAWSDCGKSRS
jgi:hypothetical protein